MRRINVYHEQIIGQAMGYGLNLDNLRKKYGLVFVIKLFRYLQKETKENNKNIGLIFPSYKKFDYKVHFSDYIQELEYAGFELKRRREDFIDEDNGEVVSILIYEFKPLK